MRLIARLALVAVVLAFSASPAQAQRISFTDKFNDGDTLGWWFPVGNWTVQSGKLVQDYGGDGNAALVEDVWLGSQSIETSLAMTDPAGWGGVAFWHDAVGDVVIVRIYPHGGGLHVIEYGVGGRDVAYGGDYEDATWYRLRVVADSAKGTLAISVNGVYLLTHTVITEARAGRSGLWSGNTGGAFDNFKVSSLGGGRKK